MIDRRTKLRMTISAVLVGFSLGLNACLKVDAEPRYTIAECLVMVKLHWLPATTSTHKNTLIDSMQDGLLREGARLTQDGDFSLFSSSVFRDQQWSRVYMRYNDQCERKTQMTEKLFAAVAPKIPGFPSYEVTKEVVNPKIKINGSSSNLCGPMWKDCSEK